MAGVTELISLGPSATLHFDCCRGVQIAAELKKSTGPKLKDFREALDKEEPAALGALRAEVEDFAKQVRFPLLV